MNVLHTDKKLTLVFEYLDQDLKRLLDTCGPGGLDESSIKVNTYLFKDLYSHSCTSY